MKHRLAEKLALLWNYLRSKVGAWFQGWQRNRMARLPKPHIGIEKHFLVARSVSHDRTRFEKIAAGVGFVFFVFGMVWLSALILVFVVHTNFAAEKNADWSNAGQALGAPIAFANLGVIILSARYLIRQITHQERVEKTKYQPVVICGGLLGYTAVGVEGKGILKITKPRLCVILRNLGDSTATFVDIIVKDLRFDNKSLFDRLRTVKFHIDQLPHEGRSDGPVRVELLLEPLNVSGSDAEADSLWGDEGGLSKLIDAVLSGGENNPDTRLELDLEVWHENVNEMQYYRAGTFTWSRSLCAEGDCDPEQKV